jgi:hypothetical protein
MHQVTQNHLLSSVGKKKKRKKKKKKEEEEEEEECVKNPFLSAVG